MLILWWRVDLWRVKFHFILCIKVESNNTFSSITTTMPPPHTTHPNIDFLRARATYYRQEAEHLDKAIRLAEAEEANRMWLEEAHEEQKTVAIGEAEVRGRNWENKGQGKRAAPETIDEEYQEEELVRPSIKKAKKTTEDTDTDQDIVFVKTVYPVTSDEEDQEQEPVKPTIPIPRKKKANKTTENPNQQIPFANTAEAGSGEDTEESHDPVLAATPCER
jgi:hypothetical protein